MAILLLRVSHEMGAVLFYEVQCQSKVEIHTRVTKRMGQGMHFTTFGCLFGHLEPLGALVLLV